MQTAILFLSILTLGQTLLLRENVVFQKLHIVTTTDARWLVTFVIQLNPFDEFLTNLTSTLDHAIVTLKALLKRYNVSHKATYFRSLQGQYDEMIAL